MRLASARPLIGTFAIVHLATTLIAGCGTDEFVLATVSGRVTIDGEPVEGVHVAFEPVADEKRKIPGPESHGVTDSDGRFWLYTTDEERKGAVVGNSRVRIWTLPGTEQKQVVMDDQDPNYDSVAEIKAIRSQMRNSRKATPKSLGIIPFRYNDQTELSFVVPPEGTSKADFAISWK